MKDKNYDLAEKFIIAISAIAMIWVFGFVVWDKDPMEQRTIKASQLEKIKIYNLEKGVNFIGRLQNEDEDDNTQLIIWHLCPGYRGSASYTIEGDAELVDEGYEAQGAAGRMGGAPVPVVLVKGPCKLKWSRTGRLYGARPDWIAIYDGEKWDVVPQGEEKLKNFLLGDVARFS